MGVVMDNARENDQDKIVAADALGEDPTKTVSNNSLVGEQVSPESENENTIGKDAEKVEDEENSSTYDNDNSSNISLEKKESMEVEAHPDVVTKDTALGVQKAEAAALVWPKKAVYGAYAWIWLCYFMLAFQQTILTNTINYAYSSFVSAPQIVTAQVLASIIGGVIKLPIAKVLTIWGRCEGFLTFTAVYILGIIVIASCNSANAYAAGYVLYWIGYDAIYLILDVFIADTSGLKNRAFAIGFASTPFICTSFTGPLAAQSFLKHSTWRWANGTFCIVMPFVFIPLALVFKYYQRKAEKMGLFKREKSGRNAWQNFVYYWQEFDMVGAFLLMAAFVLVLLPFTLQTNARTTYKSATFIVMEILGWLLFPVFFAWEKYFAKVYFVDWRLLSKRTVWSAATLMAVMYFSFYCWDSYYYSFVIVVYNLSYADTGYMTEIYNVGSCFFGPIFGLIVRWQKHFKWPTMCGLVLMILGSGLMIHFRGDDQPIGYLVMCQIFIAFGGSCVVIGSDMAVMAAANREGIPMMLSILGLSSSVGGAIGTAVTAAIYAYGFPKGLETYLPSEDQSLVPTLYAGGYLTQMTYAVGTPIRVAINDAWGYVQKLLCIACCCILVLAFPCIFLWKNYDLNRRQNKGNVI